MKHAVKRTIKLLPLKIAIAAFLLVLIGIYVAGVVYFSSHFGFKTRIDGIDSSSMSIEAVEDKLSGKISDYSIKVYGREGLSKTIKAQDMDLNYVADGQIGELLAEQNKWLWFVRFFKPGSEHETEISIKLDINQFNIYLKNAGIYKNPKARSPVDAQVAFEGNAYVVTPEDMGTKTDDSKTSTVIYNAVQTLSPSINLEEAGCYYSPTVFADNVELNERVASYNQYVPFCITYVFGGSTEVLDGATSMAWATTDADGNPALDEEKVEEWVREFGKRYDTVGSERSFKTVQGKTIAVDGGTYGWEVDEAAEVEAIMKAFKERTGETREPIYVNRAEFRSAPGQPDWGNSYIELDLTNQHIWLVQDGVVTFESDVVTGAPWAGRATPPGVYSILEKLSPTVLVGEIQGNGEPEYRTPVRYWMRMTWAGHGFHDATWQPAFGGTRYQYAGSHGCINMPYSSAGELYDLIEVGLPVISHY